MLQLQQYGRDSLQAGQSLEALRHNVAGAQVKSNELSLSTSSWAAVIPP